MDTDVTPKRGTSLGAAMVDYYQWQVRRHTVDPKWGRCRMCGLKDCSQRWAARSHLLAAGINPDAPTGEDEVPAK